MIKKYLLVVLLAAGSAAIFNDKVQSYLSILVEIVKQLPDDIGE